MNTGFARYFIRDFVGKTIPCHFLEIRSVQTGTRNKKRRCVADYRENQHNIIYFNIIIIIITLFSQIIRIYYLTIQLKYNLRVARKKQHNIS